MTHLDAPQAIFENRHDAGIQLAAALREYKGQSVVVLAIPNGGVPVALEVASALEADLDLVISRKIPLPLNPEAGFGAVADDGTIILNEEKVKRMGLSRQQIEYEASKVRAEIKQRTLLYEKDRPLAGVGDKTRRWTCFRHHHDSRGAVSASSSSQGDSCRCACSFGNSLEGSGKGR
jgi:predicted phosphoribosyltransferase